MSIETLVDGLRLVAGYYLIAVLYVLLVVAPVLYLRRRRHPR